MSLEPRSAASTLPVPPYGDMGSSSIAALPVELLCYIFSFLHFRKRIATSHVSRFWRAASLSAPGMLWSKVKSMKQTPGAITQLLARTSRAPARVRVVVGNNNAAEVAAALSDHLPHCRVLDLLVDEDLDDAHARQLGDALSRPAPLLERFILMDIFSSIISGLFDPAMLFACSAPRLTCFKLHGDLAGYATAPALANLRQIMFSPHGKLDCNMIRQCCAISAGLEVLGLELRGWAPGSDFRFSLPGSLSAFVVTSSQKEPNGPFYPPDLMARVEHAHVPLVCVSFASRPRSSTTTDLMTSVVKRNDFRIAEMTIDAWKFQEFAHIEMVSDQGQRREFLDVPLDLDADAFAHLTSLGVTEGQWPNAHVWPAAPCLVELTVFLCKPMFMRDMMSFDSVLVRRGDCSRLYCPRLQTLVFSARVAGDAALLGFVPVLGPETIREFIQLQLCFGRTRVPHLVMKGVAILEHVVPEIVALLEAVGDISSAPGHPKPARLATQDLLHWR